MYVFVSTNVKHVIWWSQ